MSIYKGTNLISGHQVLYSTTGNNTDGAMTQDATTNALNGKVDLDYSNADYQPVNKTGDTMTGALFVNTDDTANQAINIGNVSTNQRDIVFRASNHRVATIRAVKDANNNCTISIGANGVNDSAATGFLVTRDSSDNASCTFPATKCVDGQWVAVNATIMSGQSLNGSSNLTYTLSDVPNDGYKYEVLLTASITTGSTSGNSLRCEVSSDVVSDVSLCSVQTRTSNAAYARGAAIITLTTSRKIYVTRATYMTGTSSLW